MGTEYRVACRDCKVSRDLDKFYQMRDADNAEEVAEIAKEILETNAYRAALLISFMWKHKGHNCTVFNEHDGDLSEELDPFFGKTAEDGGFWNGPPKDWDNTLDQPG